MLQLALYYQHWRVVDAVLDACNNSVEKYMTIVSGGGRYGIPLYIASYFDKEDVVKKLIDKGARGDGTNEGEYGSVLYAAVYSGNNSTVKLLLDYGQAKVNQQGGLFGTVL